MSSYEVTISGDDGEFSAYLSSPTGGGPGVVVLQEIFGVNTWLRTVCDVLAGEGYVAVAPDLFWRLQPGVQLDATIEEEFNQGLDLYGKYDVDKGVDDVQATIDNLRTYDECTGKVGTTGFCLGGLLSFLSGTRTTSDGNAAYYGVGIDAALGEAGNLRAPMIMHVAGEDAYVSQEAANQIEETLQGHELVSIFNYEGCNHGFARETDFEHFDATATELAHRRTLEFFKNVLT